MMSKDLGLAVAISSAAMGPFSCGFINSIRIQKVLGKLSNGSILFMSQIGTMIMLACKESGSLMVFKAIPNIVENGNFSSQAILTFQITMSPKINIIQTLTAIIENIDSIDSSKKKD